MKFIALIAFFILPTAYAEEKEDLAKHKTEFMAGIEERIQKLQELKGCVNNASDKQAMKACHAGMKEWREGERSERQEKRKGRLEERLKKMKKKKNK